MHTAAVLGTGQQACHLFAGELRDDLSMTFYALWPLPLVRALQTEGVDTLDDLANMSPITLLSYRGVGPDGMRRIRAYLALHGRVLRGYYRPAQPVDTPAPITGVYFVRCGSFVKIGRAKDVKARIASAATFVPYELELLHLEPTSPDQLAAREAAYHVQFAALRHRGEWFRLDGALQSFLEAQTTP